MTVAEGGSVDFTPTITNNAPVEAAARAGLDLMLTGLSDAVVGDLNGTGTCSVPQTIPAGTSYSCTYPAPAMNQGGGAYVAMITAMGNFVGQTTVVTVNGQVTVTILAAAPTLPVAGAVALVLLLLGLGTLALRRLRPT